MTVRLKVAGINYLSNPAGTGGATYQASESGSTRDVVWYREDAGPLREAAIGKVVKQAYLSADARSQLNDMSVRYRTEDDVRGAGMGDYILWLDES